jgi:hypothetical protein
MRSVWMVMLLGFGAWLNSARAQGPQNMEIIWMFGGVNSSGSVVSGTNSVIAGSVGFATQINYGYQLASTKAGNLWIEVPMTFTWQGSGRITGATITSIGRNAWYFTPGLRFKTPTYGRASFYGVLGGGAGYLNKTDSAINGSTQSIIVNSSLSAHPVLDFAGGLDIRLSRLLSLRAEGRDFVTAAGLGGVAGHNHPVFLVGFAFHF